MEMRTENERSERGARTSRRSVGYALAASVLVGLFAVACASKPDSDRFTVILAPDQGQFQTQNVSLFLERRCGTLDCHGQPGRPLRIYGSHGLRLQNDAGRTPTTGDTSIEEQVANFRSVVGLEPEEMSRVVASGGGDPTRLLLLRKPLGCTTPPCESPHGERHRGGTVIGQGDPAYICLTSWLSGAADGNKCKDAANAY